MIAISNAGVYKPSKGALRVAQERVDKSARGSNKDYYANLIGEIREDASIDEPKECIFIDRDSDGFISVIGAHGPNLKLLKVWTNGRAIRKYTGQDKMRDSTHHTQENGWYKATAILVREESEE